MLSAKCGFCVGLSDWLCAAAVAPLRGPTVEDMTDSLPLPAGVEALLIEQSESLPDGRERLVEALGSWNLRLLGGLTGGYNSLVLRVEAEGAPAVLKIPPTRAAVAAEAAALRWWGEELAPRVLHVDERLGVLLIQQLRPGTAMRWVSVADSRTVLPLLRGMHEQEADSSLPLPRLRELAAETLPLLRRNAEAKNDLVDADLARQAEALLTRLFASEEHYRQVVLHGDAVPVNVLQSDDGLRVIDPRACIGEAAYDAAYWSVFSGYGHDARQNVTLLASELALDEGRVLRWAWATAVNRLLQIADSTYPGHAGLCTSLRAFVAAASPGSVA